jgi:hypothetical protein
VANSGLTYDFCGVCGGNNGTCIGCDGYGGNVLQILCNFLQLFYDDLNTFILTSISGGTYDVCGKCRGDGSTCGGCDGEGSKYDACGVCAGDNSTCLCVIYHGYQVNEMEYMLAQYTIDQIMWKIQGVMDTLLLTLEILEEYTGPGDLGVMIQYFNDFCERCLVDYNEFLDQFTFELRQSIGLEYWENTYVQPGTGSLRTRLYWRS